MSVDGEFTLLTAGLLSALHEVARMVGACEGHEDTMAAVLSLAIYPRTL